MIYILLCDDEMKILDRTGKYVDSIRCKLKDDIDMPGLSGVKNYRL